MSLNEVSHVDCREDEENFLNKRHNGRHLAENILDSHHNDVTASKSVNPHVSLGANADHALADVMVVSTHKTHIKIICPTDYRTSHTCSIA